MESIGADVMNQIELLSNETIDKIAAGEVVEKPLNVVKELVENSIDAGSLSITVEIKGGGTELIRVTDNGFGISKEQCTKAFLRHATSKLKTIEDLDTLVSLGFRGEALSSISAVSKVEMITKQKDSLLGTRVVVEGGKLLENSEIGAPDGTTIIVRSLFYNTPARRKFLKSPTSEGLAIEDIIEKFALANPEISFQLIVNGKMKVSTKGDGNLKDTCFRIFGKEIYDSLLSVSYEKNGVSIKGYTASPDFTYQARNGELYFVNKRYVKSKVINTSIEEVYRKYLMQHRFPFCVLSINVSPETIDVNVHPQKLEVKFSDNVLISECVMEALNDAFHNKELIPSVSLDSVNEETVALDDSIFEEDNKASIIKEKEYTYNPNPVVINEKRNNINDTPVRMPEPFEIQRKADYVFKEVPEYVEETLFEKKLINDEPIKEYRIIGQVFDTYWLINLEDDLYIVDQHAAHEKVNYERLLKQLDERKEDFSQNLLTPIVLHLSPVETDTYQKCQDVFEKLGFEIEEFGINSFAIRAIPYNLFGIDSEEFFHRLLDELMEKEGIFTPSFVAEKLASMSCKAAIKGGMKISLCEMQNLMKQLMSLDNPYNCPHGRPVFIKISKYELEKKFKRIV